MKVTDKFIANILRENYGELCSTIVGGNVIDRTSETDDRSSSQANKKSINAGEIWRTWRVHSRSSSWQITSSLYFYTSNAFTQLN
jgi:hypothetical protein